jgi:hypothetical protein
MGVKEHLSEDGKEFEQILANKLKSWRVYIVAMIPIFGTGTTKVWQLSDFIHKDVAHEKQQDENLLTLKAVQDEQAKQLDACRASNRQILQLVINDLALLRAVTLEVLPRKRREKVRADFERQRMNALKILIADK